VRENETLLHLHVETFVPFRIHDYVLQGGPSEQDYARVRDEYPHELGSHGDAILYREKGMTARMVNVLLDGIAVLAFVPGGVTVFGCHFEARV
jgi:hypothetical protein